MGSRIELEFEGSGQRDARQIYRNTGVEAAGHSIGQDEQRAGNISNIDYGDLSAKAQRRIGHSDPNDFQPGVISALLDGEIARQRLAEHIQMHAHALDPQIRPGGHDQGNRRQADHECLVYRRGGGVDRELEPPAEGNVGNVNRDGSAQRRGQPGAGDEHGAGPFGDADHSAAEDEFDVGRGDANGLRRRRIVGGDLLEGEIALERLTSDVEFDAQTLDPQIRASSQIQRNNLAADEEFGVDRLVGVIERKRERSAEIDSTAGNGNRNVAAQFARQTKVRYQQQAVSISKAYDRRSAGGDAQRHIVGRDSRDLLSGQRGRLLESKVAAEGLAHNIQGDPATGDSQIRPSRQVQRYRLIAHGKHFVDRGFGGVDCNRERPAERNARN